MSGGWWRVTVEADGGHAGWLSEALESRGACAVSLADGRAEPLYEPAPGETPLWHQVRISALFEDERSARAAGEWLREQGRDRLTLERVVERDWVAEGRRAARLLLFGERLAVVPEGREAPPGRVALHLDAGLAFGSGSHPSTALCLEWLEATVGGGERVCDWGCGSGVLAIAALLLGASEALAIDIDPQALQATRRNAARNGVLTRLSVCTPALAPGVPCDLLVANILAGPLVELAPELGSRLRPGGRLALAGLLAGQAEALARAYAGAVALEVVAERDGWVLLAGERPREA